MTANSPITLREYENFPEPIYISEDYLDEFRSYFSKYLEIEYKLESEKDRVKLKLRAKHYIGILKFPNNISCIILPKIENAKFFKMLEYIEPKFTTIITNLLHGITPHSNFLNLFIEQFLNLTENLFRSFLRKNYQSIVKVTETLKGKLIISETLKNPEFIQGKIVCEFDVFTLDVLGNRVIKYALYLLRYIANDSQKDKIRRLLIKLQTVSLEEYKALDLEKFRYNRFNSRYKLVHIYCKMIIERFSFGFNIGACDCFSMLLNAWDIYERFLRKIFETYLHRQVSSDLTIEKNLSEFQSWNKEKLIPDIIVRKFDSILLLCDAKYKSNYSIEDRRQGIEYIREFSKKHKRREINFSVKNRNFVLIYPSNDYYFEVIESDPEQEFGIIYAHSINLSEIDNESYLETWVSEFVKKFLLERTRKKLTLT